MRIATLSLAAALALASAGCGEGYGPIPLETSEGALVKGGDLPGETCVRRNKNGTTTPGACSIVCKDLIIYEPDTDSEVDAVSTNGGVCNQAVVRRPAARAPIGGVVFAR